MTEAFFDTTFFVDLLRGEPSATALWQSVEDGEIQGYFSPVSISELFLSRLSTPQEEHFFDGIFAAISEVPVNADVARMAGYSLRPFPVAQARRLIADALIGCSALQRNIPLYTRNVRDMQSFAGTIRRY